MDEIRARQVLREFEQEAAALIERLLAHLQPAVVSGVVADDDRGPAGDTVDDALAALRLRREAVEVLAQANRV